MAVQTSGRSHDLIQALLKQSPRTESGIYLPESAKEKPVQGKVVACGPGQIAS